MAQLKDSVVTGSLRVTDTVYSTDLVLNGSQIKNHVLAAPSNANGAPTWRAIDAADLPTAATDKLGIMKVGTGLSASNGTVSVSYGTSANTALQGNQTLFKLNNSNKTASSAAAFYAPITGGTAGHTLIASGDTEVPTWVNKGNGRVFYGTCDTPAGTTLKEVICESYDKVLTNGDILIVKFSNTNSGAVGSLQITVKTSTSDTSGSIAKNIKRLYNTTGASNLVHANELHKDAINVFVYNGTYWIMINGDYNNTYDGGEVLYSAAGASRAAETEANGGIGLHRYSLEMMTLNNTWSSIASKDKTATSNTTASDKIVSTASFMLDSLILYQGTNYNYAPGSAGGNVNGYTAVAYDLRYSCGTSTNAWTSLTYQKPVYLVGIRDGTCTFKLDSTKWWTQTLPSTDDGKIYIFLGMAYAANTIYLFPFHPIYYYKNGKIMVHQKAVPEYGTTLPSTNNYEGRQFFQVSDPWYELPSGGTPGQVLTKASNDNRDVTWASPLDAVSASLVDIIYPIGAIYISTNSISPADLFGVGIWRTIEDKFLLCASSTYTGGSTGGAASVSYTPDGTVGGHTLTTAELPSHAHGLNSHTHGLNNHTHSLNGHTHSIPDHSHTLWFGQLSFKVGTGSQYTANTVSGPVGSAGTTPSGGWSGNTGGNSNNTGGNSGNTAAATGNTANAGSGNSHNHGFTGTQATINTMPPYLAVYVWERIG